MIVGFFLGIFYTIANFIISLLPISAFPTQITTGWLYMWSLINSVSFLFPVDQLLIIIGLWYLLVKTKLLYLAVRWFGSMARGHVR